MKLCYLLAASLGAGLAVFPAQGQPGPDGPPGPGRRFGHPPIPPLIAALDTNTNGVIDADEIANASASLKTLDLNGDGKITMDELRPKPPGGTDQNRPPPPPRRHPPMGPVFAALDTNHDGVLDADEIAGASASLSKLDANGDGKLTRDELRPPGRGGEGFRPRSPRGDQPGGSDEAPPPPPPDGPPVGPPDDANK